MLYAKGKSKILYWFTIKYYILVSIHRKKHKYMNNKNIRLVNKCNKMHCLFSIVFKHNILIKFENNTFTNQYCSYWQALV